MKTKKWIPVYIIVFVASVLIILAVIDMARKGCGGVITPASQQLKVDATDSGLFINEYHHGEFYRKFGPMTETVIFTPVPDSCRILKYPNHEHGVYTIIDTIIYSDFFDTKPLQQTKDSLQDAKIQILAETVRYLFEEKDRLDQANKILADILDTLSELLNESLFNDTIPTPKELSIP